MASPVLLDACVLVPYNTADLLLRLAEAGTFRPLWSARILAETERALVESLGKEPAAADRRVAAMRAVFPDAQVNGYESLIPEMTNDEKDRHVLAAAVYAAADVLITENIKDLPESATTSFEVDVMRTDEFFVDQLHLYPDIVPQCLVDMAAARNRPPMNVYTLLDRFRKTAPEFASQLSGRL